MRTLNWKRFFILLLMLFALVCIVLGSSVYFINAEWVSAQVKKETGYDIRFEHFENSWLTDSRLSLAGVSLYRQQQPIVSIKRVDIKVDKLDVWQRQLDINNIHLSGLDIHLELPMNNATGLKKDTNVDSEVSNQGRNEAITWERLHIDSFSITDANISITNQQQQLLVNGMSLYLKDFLVINNQRLQTLPVTLNATAQIKSIALKDANQQLLFDELQLSVEGDLLQRSGHLNMDVDKIELIGALQPAMLFSAIQFTLHLEKNRIDLENFSLNAFSGSLRVQANAMLDINVLPKAEIKLKQVTLQSLLLKDMQLTIPDWQPLTDNAQQSSSLLPMEKLLIKDLHLENIDINSDNNTYPVVLKELDLQLLDLYLVQHHQWLSLGQYTEQESHFSLYFAYLNWQASMIEQFSLAGSLSENETNFLLLREHLSKP